jgi:hypothetical protein
MRDYYQPPLGWNNNCADNEILDRAQMQLYPAFQKHNSKRISEK